MTTSPASILRALAACLTLVLLAPAAALAVEEDKTPLDLAGEETARQAAEGSSGGGGFARMIVGLLVVIAVIYGLSWVVKQLKASREGQASGAGLATVSSLPLGPGRSVHLVRVGRELVLLGAAEKGVTRIRTFTEEEALHAGLVTSAEGPSSRGPEDETTFSGGSAAGLIESLRARTVRK